MKRILAAAFALALFFNYVNAKGEIASIHDPRGSERRTASGQLWNGNQLVAAHKHARLGSYVRVIDYDTGKSVDVEIIDRGPYVHNRVIDVSKATAARLGVSPKQGVFHVKVIELPPAVHLQPFLKK